MTDARRRRAPHREAPSRRGLMLIIVALLAPASLALAASARAGQIVWTAGNAIWVMNDDGTHPHQLLSGVSPLLAASLPSGRVGGADVFQNGGTTVLFVGQTSAFAPAAQPQACGADCSASYELANGLLTQLGPPAGAASGSAYAETQPRVTQDGQELFSSELTTGIGSGSPAVSANTLVERPIAANALPTQWSTSAGELEPGSGFDGAPDPADATQAAWVEAQGCSFVYNAQAACQYAVHVGGQATNTITQTDFEYVSGAGRGPTSLSYSADGSTLLLVDPFAPNYGIYSFPVAGTAGHKPVTWVLAQPPGWTFDQARFAGSKIVFDAHQQTGAVTTGDIYTVPSNCTSATCSFPASATNLTHDPTANSSDPAWTSATQPIAALRVPGGPRVMAVALPSAPIRAGRRFTLAVTLSSAGTIVVRFSRRRGGHGRAVGALSYRGRAGSNHLAIELVGGRTLVAGSYTAVVSVRGSTGRSRTIHLTVHR